MLCVFTNIHAEADIRLIQTHFAFKIELHVCFMNDAYVTYANTIVKNCTASARIRTRVLWFTRPVLYRMS